MRIAIDGRALTGPYTGDRTYWRNLIRNLVAVAPGIELTIYSRAAIPENEFPRSPRIRACVIPAANDRLWTLVAFPRTLRRDGADVAHVQYTIPPRSPCPVVTTVHDITFRLFPEWYGSRDRLLLNLTVPPSMRRAARVITDSESSRRDILRTYGLAESHVVAAPLGVPFEFDAAAIQAIELGAARATAERYGLTAPFVLSVGVFQPRKNLALLVEAFARGKAQHGLPHQLALVGKAGWGTPYEELAAIAQSAGGDAASEAVVFTGYVPDADLTHLYRACAAFAHPALYEGFGLTPIEALAVGAPTLVTDAPAMPEVVGDAALTAAPTVEAWQQALTRLLTDEDLRRSLAQRGPARAAQFDWKDTATKTIAVYERAARG